MKHEPIQLPRFPGETDDAYQKRWRCFRDHKNAEKFLQRHGVSLKSLPAGVSVSDLPGLMEYAFREHGLCFPIESPDGVGRLSSGEHCIWRILTDAGVRFDREHTFPGMCGAVNRPLRCDFYLPDAGIVVEYHGMQHYRPTGNTDRCLKRFAVTLQRDAVKSMYLKSAGIRLVVIPYTARTIYEVRDALIAAGVLHG